MSNISREDSLLNKLKSCVGSINKQNTPFQEIKNQHHPFQNLKQNYQPNASHNKIDSLLNNFNHSPAPLPQPSWKNRQPLNHYNMPIPPRRNSLIVPSYSETQKLDFQYKTKKYLNNQDEGLSTAKKYQYGLTNTKKVQLQDRPFQRQLQRDTRSPILKEGQNPQRTPRQTQINTKNNHNYQHDLRGQISKRYNITQNDYLNDKNVNQYQKSANRNSLVSKTYQQQVLQRKQILESENPAVIPQKRMLSSRKQLNVGFNNMRKDPILSQRQSPKLSKRESPKIIVKQQLTSKKQKNNVMRELLTKDMQQQKKASKGECSALLKLKKISELNQKINQRIRNIINVFQEHKC